MRTGILRKLAFFVLLMASWEIISRAHIWDEALFPSPVSVAKTLWQGIQDRSIVIATGVSLRRMLIGYGISLVFGAPLGFLIARVKWLDDTVGSLVLGMQTLPSICWLPLAILWFGLNDKAILFVVVTGSLLAITSAVKDGVRNIPPAYVRAAQTLGARPLAIYLEVLLPASLPVLLIAAKLGWSFAWRALFSGELLFVTLGLGHLLMMGRELGDMSQVIAVMVVIVALGLLTDSAIFGWLEARVRERWGFAPSN